MYIVLYFGGIWLLRDGSNSKTRELEKKEIDSLSTQFNNLIAKCDFNVFQLQKVNPGKLMKFPATGYIIVRVGDMWTLYEGGNPTPMILDKTKVSEFTSIFPLLIDQQMFNTIAIDTINPAKLLNMPPPSSASSSTGSSEKSNATSPRDLSTGVPQKNTG